ncbi:glycosyltransferase [Pedobacter aquatilis]|uniref:glycosyltransferase n=1 Tax=Pedobacter aquatilis TaxID=351343 RepID=UPI0029306FBD|nr:glycosyltransferase [Pedobacter aquatilis]
MDDLNSNQKIQSLWIGGKLSKVERLCIQSFLDYGHEFHLYTYEEIDNIPKGAKILDARLIMPEDSIFRYKEGWAKGSVSGFADVFRLLMVQKYGGWWVDMDIICLKKLDMDEDTVFCTSFEGEYGSILNNCAFKLPADSFFIESCLSSIKTIDLNNMSFGKAGPFLFQSKVKELSLEKYVTPYEYFNPISWKNVGELVLGKISKQNKIKEFLRPLLKPNTMPGRRLSPKSYTIHLWNEVWNTMGFDKDGSYHQDSLIEKLKRKHNIE